MKPDQWKSVQPHIMPSAFVASPHHLITTKSICMGEKKVEYSSLKRSQTQEKTPATHCPSATPLSSKKKNKN
jgi:hypothetical protein